jgi:hypothetical protein
VSHYETLSAVFFLYLQIKVHINSSPSSASVSVDYELSERSKYIAETKEVIAEISQALKVFSMRPTTKKKKQQQQLFSSQSRR